LPLAATVRECLLCDVQMLKAAFRVGFDRVTVPTKAKLPPTGSGLTWSTTVPHAVPLMRASEISPR
jgi:hypothetical protein